MPLSEIKSYVVVLSFYIKMIKRRTLQVSSLKHSIKKDILFSLGQTEIILVGQVGSPPSPSHPIRGRTVASKCLMCLLSFREIAWPCIKHLCVRHLTLFKLIIFIRFKLSWVKFLQIFLWLIKTHVNQID